MAVTLPRRASWVVVAVVVGAAAYASRLVPVLRDGGLFGLIGYDGGVYYAAGAGLAHGRLPYADFLLLHPPGIVLALVPFGLLGRLVGDPAAMAVARLAWMGLGAVSALLVVATLRPRGRVAALVGGLLYAVFVPAIFVERTTTLEAVTGVLTAGAVLLLTRAAPSAGGRITERAALVAGLLLGASSATKIWGVAPLLAVVVWCAVEDGRRRALVVALGGAAATTVVCLPFFLRAPRTMWDMVVGAQLGRVRVPVPWRTKAVDTAGLTEVHSTDRLLLPLVGVLVVLAVVLAVRSRVGRLACVLLVVGLGLLVATPSWSTDYASLVAAPLALLAGTATGEVLDRLDRVPVLRALAGVLVLAGLVGYTALSAPHTTFGPRFPGRSLARLVAGVPGCVTSDDPAALVEAGVLGRNLERGCPLVADLGGYSYYLRPGADLQVGRARNDQWQQFVLGYLRSGGAAVVVRFDTNVGLSAPTRATIESWPAIGTAGRYVVRRPTT